MTDDTIDPDAYTCNNCGNDVNEEDVYWDDDGDTTFCSIDCRREYRQDRAAERLDE